VRDAIETVAARMGRLDVLVHAAGIARRRSVMELEREDWDLVIATNLTGAFLCTKHAAPHMARQGGGKIIHVSSVYGLVAPSRGLQVAYTVSKHGLLGLVRANAVELAPLNIQVNAIAPGFALSEMTSDLAGQPIEAAIARRTPSGTGLAAPECFVGTCVFLASDAAAHLSGICIPIDGGYLASDGLDRG
jgi:NAD(P)-dependent dehydrogenase (short-subunit alcohol dehydrogenase family)